MEIEKELLTYWGAFLSTLLAIIKLWEFWSSRQRIEIGYSAVGLPEVGNDIIIRNLSQKPIIITYWELQFCEKKRLKAIPIKTKSPEEDFNDICIAGNSSAKINFSEMYYFNWGKEIDGRRLYLVAR